MAEMEVDFIFLSFFFTWDLAKAKVIMLLVIFFLLIIGVFIGKRKTISSFYLFIYFSSIIFMVNIVFLCVMLPIFSFWILSDYMIL